VILADGGFWAGVVAGVMATIGLHGPAERVCRGWLVRRRLYRMVKLDRERERARGWR
jgi:hypothetical protein